MKILARYHHWKARLHQAAAARGDSNEQFNLARELEAAGDLAAAEHWYRQAVDQGHTAAMNYLGLLLDDVGQTPEALKLYAAAAERGDHKAAYNAWALCQEAGDHYAALAWCRRSAALGDKDARRELNRRHISQ